MNRDNLSRETGSCHARLADASKTGFLHFLPAAEGLLPRPPKASPKEVRYNDPTDHFNTLGPIAGTLVKIEI